LNEQLAIQQKTEIQVTEALMEKASLSASKSHEVQLTPKQMELA
jgi:hypothetical protein